MQQFRTILPMPNYDFNLNHRDQIVCMGSCFAENIAHKLQSNKFATLLNPFGILFNPVSIAKALTLLLDDNHFSENEVFEHHGLWHSFAHHGHFSKPDKADALQGINTALTNGRAFLKNTNRLIVTLGTANVFVFNKSGEIVANCHKIPANEFTRKRLDLETVVENLSSVFVKLNAQIPKLQIITTVSPIRHIRDGLIENQKSKAVLLLALDEIEANLDFVHYFPSYEILLDDLRDYRFYEADLIHPNKVAIDYIWDYFKQSFFSKATIELISEIEKIVNAINHRPFHPESALHQTFLKQQLEKTNLLEEKFPFLDFNVEKAVFENQFL
jgi:GSCFA family